MKNEKLFHGFEKTFLSQEPEEASAVTYHVTVRGNTEDEPFTKNGEPSFDCELRVQDCNRAVQLEFNVYVDDSDEMFTSRMNKIDTFINVLIRFRGDYAKARDIYKQAKADHEKGVANPYIPHAGDICDVMNDKGVFTHMGVLVRFVEFDADGIPKWVIAYADVDEEPFTFRYDNWTFVKRS